MGGIGKKPGNYWRKFLEFFQALLVSAFIVLLGPVISHGRYAAVAWVLGVSIMIPAYSLRWALKRSIRCRVAALFIIYVSILSAFAALYYGTFLHNPQLYAFSSSIQEGKAYEQFGPQLESVLELNNRLYLLGILDSHLDRAMEALKDPMTGNQPPNAIASTQNVHRLDERYSVRFLNLQFAFPPAGIVYSHTLEVYENGKRTVFGGADDPFDSQVNCVTSILSSKNEEEFRQNLRTLISLVQASRNSAIATLQGGIVRRPDWEFVDFCYFSSVVMTTVGFGDILPDSTTARMIVLTQSILAVFYLGFSLVFLWPDRERAMTEQCEASTTQTRNPEISEA